jgi:hypothetical protein
MHFVTDILANEGVRGKKNKPFQSLLGSGATCNPLSFFSSLVSHFFMNMYMVVLSEIKRR